MQPENKCRCSELEAALETAKKRAQEAERERGHARLRIRDVARRLREMLAGPHDGPADAEDYLERLEAAHAETRKRLEEAEAKLRDVAPTTPGDALAPRKYGIAIPSELGDGRLTLQQILNQSKRYSSWGVEVVIGLAEHLRDALAEAERLRMAMDGLAEWADERRDHAKYTEGSWTAYKRTAEHIRAVIAGAKEGGG